MDDISLYGLFCDDIRQEISGKVSLIGMYGTHMYVPVMPIKLPKLCVHFSLRFPLVHKPVDIAVTVKNGDRQIHEVKVEGYQNGESIEGAMQELNGGFDMPFLEIDEPTTLIVTASVDGVEVTGPCLAIGEDPSSKQD
ncbi:hypothetical protein ABIE61_000310 [Marinobacterium sp. MBR-111]|uniref:DUF6941 family protein n=1 Tax=Marinobacterium sp. MBR-111 TaxID=3156463 RepID=UPI00339908BB